MLVSKEKCTSLDDQEIIRKSLVELDYFSCLYQRYETQLLRYIRRITHVSDAEAEDILQESFIKIWKNLREFDQTLKLSSWIYRIVHNQAVSYWRKGTSYGKKPDQPWEESRYAGIPDTPSPDPDRPDEEEQVQKLLEQLPLPYKEVLVLKFLEDLSYAEISDVLKIPEGTVATRINRAKKAMAGLAARQPAFFEP